MATLKDILLWYSRIGVYNGNYHELPNIWQLVKNKDIITSGFPKFYYVYRNNEQTYIRYFILVPDNHERICIILMDEDDSKKYHKYYFTVSSFITYEDLRELLHKINIDNKHNIISTPSELDCINDIIKLNLKKD